MKEHECIIGLLYYDYEDVDIATLEDLNKYIEETKDINRNYRSTYNQLPDWLYRKEYTLQDYADKRKSTNFTRFDFCPYCGKKIDWKKIKGRKEE